MDAVKALVIPAKPLDVAQEQEARPNPRLFR
jgi:hypothetical protein